jgi:hypothetical protein
MIIYDSDGNIEYQEPNPRKKKMMNAKEAQDRVNSLESEKNTKQLSICEKAINDAVNGGSYSTNVNFWLTQPVINQLKTLGYDVRCESDRNESSTSISWKQIT